jgi:hypothetical protein
MSVARFIDRQNVTGLHLQALANQNQPETQTGRMVQAKRNAEDFLLGRDGLLEHRQVFNVVSELWESQKRVVGKENELELLQQQVELTTQKIADERATLRNALHQAAMTIYAFGHNLEENDRIFLEEEGGNQARLQIGEINNLYLLLIQTAVHLRG